MLNNGISYRSNCPIDKAWSADIVDIDLYSQTTIFLATTGIEDTHSWTGK